MANCNVCSSWSRGNIYNEEDQAANNVARNYRKRFDVSIIKYWQDDEFITNNYKCNHDTTLVTIRFFNWKNTNYTERHSSELFFYNFAGLRYGMPVHNSTGAKAVSNQLHYSVLIDHEAPRKKDPYELMRMTYHFVDLDATIGYFDAYKLTHHDKCFSVLMPTKEVELFVKDLEIASTGINSFLNYKLYSKVMTGSGCIMPNFYRSVMTGEKNLIIILKPSCFRSADICKMVYQFLITLRVDAIRYFKSMPLYLVREFYPHCESRPYGEMWETYLTSGPSAFIVVAYENAIELESIRKQCLHLRDKSNIIWNRNIIHCSATEEEARDNMKVWETYLKGENTGIFEHAFYDPTPYVSRQEIDEICMKLLKTKGLDSSIIESLRE